MRPDKKHKANSTIRKKVGSENKNESTRNRNDDSFGDREVSNNWKRYERPSSEDEDTNLTGEEFPAVLKKASEYLLCRDSEKIKKRFFASIASVF